MSDSYISVAEYSGGILKMKIGSLRRMDQY